jgi:fatty-acyl-CoA synthase
MTTTVAVPSSARAPQGGLSQVFGGIDRPLDERTVSRLLDHTAARFGQRPAAVFREQHVRWTWHELQAEVDRLAAGLHSLGIGKGDRLGIWSPNRYEWLLAQFATARLGVILVNVNPAYRLAELEYALNKVECKALITAPSFKTSRYLEMLQTLAPELAGAKPGELGAAKLPHLRLVIRMGAEKTPGMLNFGDVLARGDEADAREAVAMIEDTLDCREPINIQFTSGTTGSPKGATLTHHNIVNNAGDIAQQMQLTERDSLCIPVPLYHCFGMVLGVLACVSAGTSMVFPSEGF